MKHIFIIAAIMSIHFTANAQMIEFCIKGLNLFHMGTRLRSDVKADLTEIDTSTIEGEFEYSDASSRADGKGYIFRKLSARKYQFQWADSLPVNIYVGYTSDEIIRQIVVNCSSCDQSRLKMALIEVFGNPAVEGSASINGMGHESFLLSAGDFNVFFSGIDGSIRFYYPESIESLTNDLSLD
jgi:hypothetical protein